MPKATYEGTVLAAAPEEKVEIVEGNVYFPPDAVKDEHLKESDTPYTCPWKGEAQYYTVETDGGTVKDGAFSYPEPKPAAKHIAGYVAFWKDVEVEE